MSAQRGGRFRAILMVSDGELSVSTKQSVLNALAVIVPLIAGAVLFSVSTAAAQQQPPPPSSAPQSTDPSLQQPPPPPAPQQTPMLPQPQQGGNCDHHRLPVTS